MHAKDAARAIVRDFARYDLLTYSSAIAFQALYAVIPLTLLGLSGLGLFGLESVYAHHIAPTLRHDLSHDAFGIANRTALKVMSSKRVFWATIGLLVTLWGVGAALRSMMRPLNEIYGTEEHRSWKRRLITSLVAGAIVMACIFGAIVLVPGGRLVHPSGTVLAVGFFALRWVVTVVLLLLAIGTIIRAVPAKKRPPEWVTIGSGISALCWIVASLGFAAYISAVSYSSFYGALAAAVILLIYVHVAAIAFLLGVVVDAQLREQVSGRGGASRRGGRRRQGGTSGTRRGPRRAHAR